jgi:hypothetical protein
LLTSPRVAVKYDWLVPLSLERADQQQLDYGGLDPLDPEDRYRERGLAMLELVRRAEEPRRMLPNAVAAARRASLMADAEFGPAGQ